jgi:hypothetical protein
MGQLHEETITNWLWFVKSPDHQAHGFLERAVDGMQIHVGQDKDVDQGVEEAAQIPPCSSQSALKLYGRERLYRRSFVGYDGVVAVVVTAVIVSSLEA